MGCLAMEEYRIVMPYKSKNGRFVDREIIATGEIKPPESIMDLGAVVYQPQHVILNELQTRGEITQKHCEASAHDDAQAKIKELTLIATKEEGFYLAAFCWIFKCSNRDT